ncbi:multidrug resistance-associated protein 7 [Esox lucius]|nr:multidrug resistance-associated protein 7 [Esox lucius]XP_019905466.2 multidrug resistance-associated protein 7 [Esox lucius]XP_019905467.2 multidrug resistance-associated protein 7 [Esox lucius]XP_028978153.2 multidrug resistance-associated protein 7 [Esox lucius]
MGVGIMADFGPREFISGLCHTDSLNPFPVWQDGAISHCFNQLILGALAHCVVAVFSACYLSAQRCSLFRSSPPCAWGFRLTSALLVALLFLGDVILVALLHQGDVYLDVLADGCAILAWLVHFGALLVLRGSVYRTTRGPCTLLLLVLLPLPNLVVTLLAYAQDATYLDLGEPLRVARLALAAARVLPLLAYLLAFGAPCVAERSYASMSVNDADDSLLIPESSLQDTGEMVAEDECSCVSRLLYLWLNPLLRRGRRGELERPCDVYLLPRKLRTDAVRRHFFRCWEDCQQGAAAQRGNTTTRPISKSLQNGSWTSPLHEDQSDTIVEHVGLLKVLHKAFGPWYYLLGLLKLACKVLGFAGPLLLSSLVNYMEEEDAPISWGAWCAAGLFFSTFTSAIIRNLFIFEVSKVALTARAALVTAVYRKALRVSGGSLAARFTLGEVVNLMSTDADRVVGFFNSFHEVWSLPFQLSVALYLLYLQVGVAFLGGLGVALLLVPLNKVLATRIVENNKHMLAYKDSRVKLMTEVLYGIRVIKFYNWEAHFARRIAGYREQELSHLKATKYLDALCVYTWAALPIVISILTFITYVLLGHQLTAAKVFTTLALVGMLILPLNSFPWVLNSTLEAKVSLDRIQRFIKLPDQDLGAYYSHVAPEDPRVTIVISRGTFSWLGPGRPGQTPEREAEGDTASPGGSLLLRCLDLTVSKGLLVVVVGKVGCGKSSLLAAITGELSRLGGTVYVQGREDGFGLAAQEPWIQHATVRDNILFGRDYDSGFYQAVVEACALTDDLNILPNGDRTEVGENGVTLSGGQKARLALARAVYMEKDIYLLDDPLAAVDADVACHLMEKCIMGILGSKTRILCTHRIEFVDKADVVILMENGTIIKTGSPEEVLPLVEAVPKNRKNHNNVKDQDVTEQEENLSLPNELRVEEECSLLGEEQKAVGGLSWKVYHAYWRAVGGALAGSVLLALLLMQGTKNLSDWWLSYWISNLKNNGSAHNPLTPAYTSPHLLLFFPGGLVSSVTTVVTAPSSNMSAEVNFYLTVYGSVAGANTVFTAFRAFLFAYGGIRAASVIHNRLLSTVLKATVTFFDTTPLGRVLNRFSADLYSVDDTLPFVLNILLANVFGLLGTLVVMGYGLPWVLLPVLPLGLLYHRAQRFYRHTSRELKRLSSVTLSPLYSHFSETLSGLATIRACSGAARFEEENEKRLELNQRCRFLSNAAMQWLDIRLQMIGVAVVTAISVIAVIQHQYKSIDPGLVGLSLAYALSITDRLSGLIFSFTQTEMQLVSVERTEEYSNSLPTEPQQDNPQVPASWPELGWVEFRGAVLAYREGLPNALDGVSLMVRPGEKVGVVGRTGSGKSTLFLALFRMVELNQGQILLDGVDTSQVGLTQLRSKLAIIPQDPFLFSGTVRENLDPCGLHPDHQLMDALGHCHLIPLINRIGGLEAEVGERGRSLSLGQRQLLCLARALLTEAKILCIDEATASVDQKTDKLLQQTIREKFQDKTVLTIAHRINTIMDSDRVLVMHSGKVVEYDTPAALCQREDSMFSKLVGGRRE